MLKIFLSYAIAVVMVTSVASFAGNNGNSKDNGNAPKKDDPVVAPTPAPTPAPVVTVAPVLPEIGKDRKGEDCDPAKVAKSKNKCLCDPATNDWVIDECLPKCQTGQIRIEKICQVSCSATEIAFNGGCVKKCDVGQILDSKGNCMERGTCIGCKSKCQDGQVLNQGICVENCGNNSELIGTKCYQKCGNYYERVGVECVERCGNTKERVGMECLDSCGNSRERVGHDCRDKCKDGYKRADTGECIACPFDSVATK